MEVVYLSIEASGRFSPIEDSSAVNKIIHHAPEAIATHGSVNCFSLIIIAYCTRPITWHTYITVALSCFHSFSSFLSVLSSSVVITEVHFILVHFISHVTKSVHLALCWLGNLVFYHHLWWSLSITSASSYRLWALSSKKLESYGSSHVLQAPNHHHAMFMCIHCYSVHTSSQ